MSVCHPRSAGRLWLTCQQTRNKFALRSLDPDDVAQGWQKCTDTALRWAMAGGGRYIQSVAMTDIDLLRPGALLDTTFLAAALLNEQMRDAHMVAEVVLPSDDAAGPVQWHRAAGCIAVGLRSCAPFAQAALVSDFSSSAVRHCSSGCRKRKRGSC